MTRRFTAGAWSEHDTEALIGLLDTARHAPSAGFSQGTRLLVLDGDALAAFWEHSGLAAWFAGRAPGVLDAAALVVVTADRGAYLARYRAADKAGHGLGDPEGWPVPHWIGDAAMVVHNLLLLIDAQGWGALYFGLFRNLDEIRAVLGVPTGIELLGAVAVGFRAADDAPRGSAARRERLALGEQVNRGGWGHGAGWEPGAPPP